MRKGKLTYETVQSGEWFTPRPGPEGWFQQCCDCGLVHKFEFDRPVRIRVFRDNRKTAAIRRNMHPGLVELL